MGLIGVVTTIALQPKSTTMKTLAILLHILGFIAAICITLVGIFGIVNAVDSKAKLQYNDGSAKEQFDQAKNSFKAWIAPTNSGIVSFWGYEFHCQNSLGVSKSIQ